MKTLYPSFLTDDDAKEFQELLKKEYGEEVSLECAHAQADALLWWCQWAGQALDLQQHTAIKTILEKNPAVTPLSPKPENLSEQETTALAFIRASLGKGESPSVRQVCCAVGLRSSRSGLRLIHKLIEKGCLRRDEQGKLELIESKSGKQESLETQSPGT